MNNDVINFENKVPHAHIFFSLNDIVYSVPIYCVVEIMQFCQLRAPQKLQKYCIGLLDYNGLILNVVDIREILGLEKTVININQCLLLLKTEESIFAIVVDKILSITDIDYSTLQISPHNTKNFIQSIYNDNDKIVSVINIPAIEEEIKNAQVTENEVFQLPVLNEQDTQIAITRAQSNRDKYQNYSPVKYYDYNKYLLFSVGKINFCFDISCIETITDAANFEICHLPNHVDYIEGVVNFRGIFLTVINFANFIGNESDNQNDNSNKKIIILSGTEFNVAFLVDKILEIRNLAKDEFKCENEYSNIYPFVRNQIVKDNELYFIVDTELLLKDNKMYINE